MARNYNNRIRVEILGADMVIEDAHIAVDCDKTDEKTPNYCEITIFNMSDDTYNRINSRANSGRVYTDINNSGWVLLFEGNLRNLLKYKKTKANALTKTGKQRKIKKAEPHYNEPPIRREASGADVATIICLEDGKKNLFFDNYVNKSYFGSVTNRYVLDDILSDVKRKSSNIKISANSNILEEYTYQNGKVFSGTLQDVLSSICKTGNAICTVQDDVIIVATNNPDKKNVGYVYLLNGTNCPSPEANTDKELDIDAPFIQALNPLNFIKLDFKDYQGLFQVKRVHSKIDNFGDDFESKITVKLDI